MPGKNKPKSTKDKAKSQSGQPAQTMSNGGQGFNIEYTDG